MGWANVWPEQGSHESSSAGGLKPAHEFTVRIAFHRDIANQFSNGVLAIKPALTSTFVNSEIADRSFYIFRCDYSTFSPVFDP